jgi:hypothetical protein
MALATPPRVKTGSLEPELRSGLVLLERNSAIGSEFTESDGMNAEIVGGLLSVEPVSMLRLLVACL